MGESDTLLQIPTEQVWRLLQISRGVGSSPQKLHIFTRSSVGGSTPLLTDRSLVRVQPGEPYRISVMVTRGSPKPELRVQLLHPVPYKQDACEIKVK